MTQADDGGAAVGGREARTFFQLSPVAVVLVGAGLSRLVSASGRASVLFLAPSIVTALAGLQYVVPRARLGAGAAGTVRPTRVTGLSALQCARAWRAAGDGTPSRPRGRRAAGRHRVPRHTRRERTADSRSAQGSGRYHPTWRDRQERLQMTIRDSRGGERQRDLMLYERRMPGDERQSIVFFEAPAEVKGTGFVRRPTRAGRPSSGSTSGAAARPADQRPEFDAKLRRSDLSYAGPRRHPGDGELVGGGRRVGAARRGAGGSARRRGSSSCARNGTTWATGASWSGWAAMTWCRVVWSSSTRTTLL